MIITSSHQKGGVGKSTILWNLAIELSKISEVFVVDLDMQKTITHSLEIRKKNTKLSNISILKINSKDELIKLRKLSKKNDLILIDSGGFDSLLNRYAIATSDILLTPVSSKFYELLGLKEYEKILRYISKKVNRTITAKVFFNKINPNTKDLKSITSFIKKSEYFSLMESIIRQRVDYENSPAEGKSVVEFNEKGMASIEFNEFKKEIIKHIKNII